MIKNPNMQRVRIEGGHAWSLKGKCRFCGMTKVLFELQNRPDCPHELPKRKGKGELSETLEKSGGTVGNGAEP